MNQQDVKKESVEFNKLEKKLRRNVGNAIVDYNMVEDGDVIMACISGGKDSFAMLDILLKLKQVAPIKFDVIAVNLDQKQPGFPEHILPEYFEALGVPYYIIDKDTYSVVKEKIPEGKTTCGLCSRLRRGTLYSFAEKIGATKVALGHHMDDIVETMFLNMFHGARLKAMPPKLLSDDKRNIVIRPLAYCREKDLISYAEKREFPIIPCNLCGSQENLQRQNVKAMLNEWDRQHSQRVYSIFKSIQNVSPSQLADEALYAFKDLAIDRSGERKEYEYSSEEISSSGTGTEVQYFDINNL
ncbi:tRNA 2-thiocytidine(32) synthetase TtcA [Thalassomonas actiniarum]|uniref:tRNA-cytidine(32) 2-sulfurtransferase n=1 Tax=Thalassomonas actiniarum TaxID=485447 RepID=A0AAF0C208_9GAMM|nr:tRNA 2-thiocytidine(32) synthetase TtcA [Thalassomonas actiniarum]WDD97269.1 tRNA 2-thiocytidine(32) synthetase TtcA [Thalassomonas actiniarum]